MRRFSLDNFETPENKQDATWKIPIQNTCEKLWADVYAESFRLYGNSKATKDADKAVKEYKARFK